MKASELDEQDGSAPLASSREWLQVVGCALAIVLLCVVWTFWA